MLFACPQCQAKYRIRAGVEKKKGRKARCKKCGHVFLPTLLPLGSGELTQPPAGKAIMTDHPQGEITVQCPQCQVGYHVNKTGAEWMTDQEVSCTHCNHLFLVADHQVVGEAVCHVKLSAGGSLRQLRRQPEEAGGDKSEAEKTGVKASSGQVEIESALARIAVDETLLAETFATADAAPHIDLSETILKMDNPETRYEELGSLGKGGMGEVLLARDTQLLRKVAIKVVHDENPTTMNYFLREAQITAQLDHPNIVPLYSVRQARQPGQKVSFVMKLIKGKTLADIIIQCRKIYKKTAGATLEDGLDLPARLEYFLKVCDSISYAHRKQVIHCDIKPVNIMVGDFGEVYVMDWGIAKLFAEKNEDRILQEDTAEERAGKQAMTASVTSIEEPVERGDTWIESLTVSGSPGYMSPEQAKRGQLTPRTDIFSLGIMLFELVCLKPARLCDANKKYEMALKGQLDPVSHLLKSREIPADLVAIIRKATAAEPTARYRTVAALATDVRAFLLGEEVSVRPDNLPRRLVRFVGKNRTAAAIALLALFSLSLVVIVDSLYRSHTALQTAHFREQVLTDLQAEISSRAHAIDSKFLTLEGLVAGLANDLVYHLAAPKAAAVSPQPLYQAADYQQPATAPPDYTFSPLYKKSVSVNYPVVKRAPGVSEAAMRKAIAPFLSLRYHFRQMLLQSGGYDQVSMSKDEADILLKEMGVPIRWAYVGLATGVMYAFPGKSTYADDYDPRQRPWYLLGTEHTEPVWGSPYIDVQGQGLVLPCAVAAYQQGKHLGVVGMDVTFSDIILDDLSRTSQSGTIKSSYLLDEKGRVVISSAYLDDHALPMTVAGKLRLVPFSVDEVVQGILRKSGGLVEQGKGNQHELIVFVRLPALNWYYVERLDANSVFSAGRLTYRAK